MSLQHPNLNLNESATDANVIKSIWSALTDAIKQHQFLIPFAEETSIPLWGCVDDNGRNILHYLCIKKAQNEPQAQYLTYIPAKFLSTK